MASGYILDLNILVNSDLRCCFLEFIPKQVEETSSPAAFKQKFLFDILCTLEPIININAHVLPLQCDQTIVFSSYKKFHDFQGF